MKKGNLLFALGDIINSKYEVLKVYKGSMGIVYKIKDLKYDPAHTEHNEVLITKSLQPEYVNIPEIKEQFLNEAYNWINIYPHRNILRAYHVMKVNDIPFINADYIEGGLLPNKLTDWINKKLTPLEVALNFFMQIYDGLEHATRNNNIVCHGDLKPDNILIDEYFELKIADWGLSQIRHNIISETKAVSSYKGSGILDKHSKLFGNNRYTAPELIVGKNDPNFATDIYSLGVLTYEMIFGKHPEVNTSIKTISFRIKEDFYLPDDDCEKLANVLLNLVSDDPEFRTKSLTLNIEYLKDLFSQLTGMRLEPPSITIEMKNKQWEGQVAFSMFQLGEYEEGYNKMKSLIGKGGEKEDVLIWDMDNNGYAYSLKAYEKLRKEYESDPTNISKIQNLDNILFFFKDFNLRKKLNCEILAIDGKNIKAINNLIDISINENCLKEALKWTEKLKHIQDDKNLVLLKEIEVYCHFDMIEEAIIIYEKMEDAGKLNLNQQLAYGDLLAKTNHYIRAVNIFKKVINENENNSLAWYNLGVCYRQLNQIEKCIECFHQVIDKGKDEYGKGEAFNHLGSIYMIKRDIVKAEEMFKSALKYSSSNYKIYYNLGLCQLIRKELNEARRYMELAISFKPDYELAITQLNNIKKKLCADD